MDSSEDDDFFDTPSFDDEWLKQGPKRVLRNDRAKDASMKNMSDSTFGSSLGEIFRESGRRNPMEDTEDMMSSLDLTGDVSNARNARRSMSSNSFSLTSEAAGKYNEDSRARRDFNPKCLSSSGGSSSEESMHTCSSGIDSEEEDSVVSKRSKRSKVARKPPSKMAPKRPAPLSSPQNKHSSKPLPKAPRNISKRGIQPSDHKRMLHTRTFKGKSSRPAPPSKLPPPRPRAASSRSPSRGRQRLKPLNKLSLSGVKASTAASMSKQPQSVEDFAKSFRTSLNRSREHKLGPTPLNLRIDINDSNRATPGNSPLSSSSSPPVKLSISIADSNRRTPPGSDEDNDDDEVEDVGNNTFRAGLRGALSDLIEEDADEASSSSRRDRTRSGHASTQSKSSTLQKRSNRKNPRDVGAASYNFTESGAFSMDGFRLKESGIMNVPGMKQPLRPGQISRDLVKLSVLGKGASGSVYKALHIPTLRLCAVKEIAVFEAEKRRQMIVELQALYKNIVPIDGGLSRENESDRGSDTKQAKPAPCPFVVSFFDAYMNTTAGSVSIVMEHMDGGSLQDIVDTGGCPNESVLKNISFRVLKGLAFIHERHQIHRDIKPSNLLINHWGEVKVSDFGIVKELDDSLAQAKTFVGTLSYMSPERISGQEYSYESDIWSVGLSIMALAMGRFPLNSSSGYWGLLHKLRDEPSPELPSDMDFSDDFRDFLRQCLIKDPKKRPSAKTLLAHRFVRNCVIPKIDHDEAATGTGSDTARFELNDICDKVMRQVYVIYSNGRQSELRSLPVEAKKATKDVDDDDDTAYEIPPLDRRKMGYLARQLGLDSTTVHQKFERKRIELNAYMTQQLEESRRSFMSTFGDADSTV